MWAAKHYGREEGREEVLAVSKETKKYKKIKFSTILHPVNML
jgi:hypothetical protein